VQRSIEDLRHKLTLIDALAENSPDDGASLNGKLILLKEILSSMLDQMETLRNVRAVSIRRGINLYDEVRRFEIDIIECALEQTSGNQARAARLLGINQTTLNQKIKRYNIPVADYGAYPSPLKATA
jgi:DNA-binding protein Fis